MKLTYLFNRRGAHTVLLGGVLSAAVGLTAFPVSGKTGDENRLKINISGTVVATGSCVFVDPMPKDISFGDIRYSSVTGANNLTGNYIRPLDNRMRCSGDVAGSTHFRFESRSGTPVSDGSHKLLPVVAGRIPSPPNKNLGIRLLVNGKPQYVGSDFSVDINNLPKMEAELVQLNPDDTTWVNGQKIVSHAILTLSFD